MVEHYVMVVHYVTMKQLCLIVTHSVLCSWLLNEGR